MNLKRELAQAEEGYKIIQKENKHLLNRIEAVNTEKVMKDVDLMNMREQHEKFKEEKEKFEKDKTVFNRVRQEIENQMEAHKHRLIQLQQEFEDRMELETYKYTSLESENLALKEAKENELKIEQELVSLLKDEHNQNMDFFKDFKTDLHPALDSTSLAQNIGGISDLKNEIYNLKLLLINEQTKTQNAEKLCQILKKELE